MTLPDSNSQEGGKVDDEQLMRRALRYLEAEVASRLGWGILESMVSAGDHPVVADLRRRLASPTPSQEGRSSLSVEGWQPIETAPKDGTTVIAYRPTKPPHIEGMHCVDGAWYWSYDGDGPDYSSVGPSHWMPLPNPPEQA